jgi:signal transduction histidine kinase
MFLAVMLLLAGTLGWLGWRLLEQEQQLWVQRALERNESAADVVVAGLEKKLSAIERNLDHVLAGGEPAPELAASDHMAVVHTARGLVRSWPEHRLVYVPALQDRAEAPPGAFAAADRLEFQKQDYAGAIAELRKMETSRDADLRAAALVRLCRNFLKSGQAEEALANYERLSALGEVRVGGLPAALAARAGTLGVFEKQNDRNGAQRAARALYADLQSGLWPITPATYAYLAGQASRWLDEKQMRTGSGVPLSEGVEWLWESARSGAGRSQLRTSSGSVLLVWRSSGAALAGFAATPEFLERSMLADLARSREVALISADGQYLWGSRRAASVRGAIRLASATQLPWTVQVYSPATSQELEALRARRRLLIGGMCALVALILTGGWFVGRAVTRELAVARLQSDFVAAVSHEFRTPLTTLCQLSELLMRGRVATENDRNEYYGLLHKESHRLRRLLESVLDFGRLEAGRMQFRFERVDLAEMTQMSAAEFTAQPQALGHHFEVVSERSGATVRADRDALRCVLWNLFENAAKYSPDCDRVWVQLAEKGRHLEIAVRDRGVGIPGNEQRRIFDKFVRGRAARESNIRGTGIGLAVARQIVRAHGGEITVESEPGKGSTFRVLLPQTD